MWRLRFCDGGCLGLFFRFRVGPLAALNSCALCSLAALLPISTFFGAEPIFLVLFLFVCACAMRLLNENPLPLYLLLGVLTALAWLAKSSTTPFSCTVPWLQHRPVAPQLKFWREDAVASSGTGLAARSLPGWTFDLLGCILCHHRSAPRPCAQDVGKRVLQFAEFLVLGRRLGNVRK